MRTSRICSPSSSACTTTAHSLHAHSRRDGSCVHNRRAMDDTILSGDLRLSAHVAVPSTPGPSLGLVLCHGLPEPAARRGDGRHDLSRPRRPHRATKPAGSCSRSTSAAPGRPKATSRRAAGSTTCATRCACCTPATTCAGVWVAGFGHGGTFAVCEAADDHLVRGVATIASPSTLRDWAQDPGRLLVHARSMGMIRTEGFPTDATGWVRDIGRIDAVAAAAPARPSSAARAARRRGRRGAARRRPRARRRRPAELGAAGGAGRRPPAAPRPAGDRHAPRLARPPGPERHARSRCRRRDRPAASQRSGRPRAAARTSSSVRSRSNSGAHAGVGDELGGVADEHRHVDRPHELVVGRRRAADGSSARGASAATSPTLTPRPEHTL